METQNLKGILVLLVRNTLNGFLSSWVNCTALVSCLSLILVIEMASKNKETNGARLDLTGVLVAFVSFTQMSMILNILDKNQRILETLGEKRLERVPFMLGHSLGWLLLVFSLILFLFLFDITWRTGLNQGSIIWLGLLSVFALSSAVQSFALSFLRLPKATASHFCSVYLIFSVFLCVSIGNFNEEFAFLLGLVRYANWLGVFLLFFFPSVSVMASVLRLEGFECFKGASFGFLVFLSVFWMVITLFGCFLGNYLKKMPRNESLSFKKLLFDLFSLIPRFILVRRGLLSSSLDATIIEMGSGSSDLEPFSHTSSAFLCQALTAGLRNPKPKPVLRVERVTVRKSRTKTIDKVSLTFYESQIYCVLGSKGSGTSSLLDVLAGEVAPNKGKVDSFGSKVLRVSLKDEKTAASSTEPHIGKKQRDIFFGNLSCLENLLVFSRGIRNGQATYEKAFEALCFAGLNEKENVLAKDLLPSERCRLFLALEMMNSPDVLLLGNFSEKMDEKLKEAVVKWIERLRGSGKSVIIFTESLGIAEGLAEHLIVMTHGFVLADGSPKFIRGKLEREGRIKCTLIIKNTQKTDFIEKVQRLFNVSRDNLSMNPVSNEETSISWHLATSSVLSNVHSFASFQKLGSLFFETLTLEQITKMLPSQLMSLIDSSDINLEGLVELKEHFQSETDPINLANILSVEAKKSFWKQLHMISTWRVQETIESPKDILLLVFPFGLWQFLATLFLFIDPNMSFSENFSYQNGSQAKEPQQYSNNPDFLGLGSGGESVVSLVFGKVLIMIVFCCSCFFGMSVVRSRESKSRQILHLSGCSTSAFWLGAFVGDFVLFWLSTIMSILFYGMSVLVFSPFEEWKSFRIAIEMVKQLFLKVLPFSISHLSCGYLFSFFFKKTSRHFSYFNISHFFFVFIGPKVLQGVFLGNLPRLLSWMLFSPQLLSFESSTESSFEMQISFALAYSVSSLLLVMALDECFVVHSQNFSFIPRILSSDSALGSFSCLQTSKGTTMRPGSFELKHRSTNKIFSENSESLKEVIDTLTGIANVRKGRVVIQEKPKPRGMIANLLLRTLFKKHGRIPVIGRHFVTGYASCEGVAFDDLTVQDHLSFVSGIRGVQEEDTGKLVLSLLRFFGMEDLTKVHGRDLSKREKKKLALMMALAGNPKLQIYEEPTKYLDPITAYKTQEALNYIQELGITTIITSSFFTHRETAKEVTWKLSKNHQKNEISFKEVPNPKNILRFSIRGKEKLKLLRFGEKVKSSLPDFITKTGIEPLGPLQGMSGDSHQAPSGEIWFKCPFAHSENQFFVLNGVVKRHLGKNGQDCLLEVLRVIEETAGNEHTLIQHSEIALFSD